MVRRTVRRTTGHAVHLPEETAELMRSRLPGVADRVVTAVIAEVPSYEGALSGSMGENIRKAVQLALGGFLSLAGDRSGADQRTPAAPAVEGAYQLGRGEARSGRSIDALLAAYRIGARVSWREMSTAAVEGGIVATDLVSFAELVFAYIDELSAASVAGHTDELETTGRVRQRLLERLAGHLLEEASSETVEAAAERAGWDPPTTLTAVLLAESQVRPALAVLPEATLVGGELPDQESGGLVLVPDMGGSRRPVLLRSLSGRSAVVGPAVPWQEARASYDRALRGRALAGPEGMDTEAHLAELVLTSDPAALADLRAQILAPLAGLRPATAEKLLDTLRSWLLHHGRREAMAEELFVHPQTVRYRMGQLRDVYGDRLEDPATVLALTVALGVPGAVPPEDADPPRA